MYVLPKTVHSNIRLHTLSKLDNGLREQLDIEEGNLKAFLFIHLVLLYTRFPTLIFSEEERRRVEVPAVVPALFDKVFHGPRQDHDDDAGQEDGSDLGEGLQGL